MSDDSPKYQTMAQIVAERDALAARVAALREVLRKAVIVELIGQSHGCKLCGERWPDYDGERHAPGCLAAPESA